MSRTENSHPRIGLALSGGAARGIAHVGVLCALTEHNIPIDCIGGTSAGALVGAAFASGMTVADLKELGHSLRWRNFGRLTVSRRGIQSSERMEEFLRARLPLKRFEDLRIPFAAVATDLHSGEAVVMRDRGDLAFAVRASCAIPGWYVPVTDAQGRELVDGGLVAVVPVKVTRELGAEIVIAVDVNSEGAKFLGTPQSIIGIILQSMMVVQRMVSAPQVREADLAIRPRVGHIRWDEMSRAAELLAAGYEAGVAAIPAIRSLLAAATNGKPLADATEIHSSTEQPE